MKNIWTVVIFVIGCNPVTERINIVNGRDGSDGKDGSILQNYTLDSSCTNVDDGYYAKRDNDTIKLYKDLPGNSGSDCDGSGSNSNFVTNLYAEHKSNGEASIWLTSNRLAFNDNNGNLKVIKFN